MPKKFIKRHLPDPHTIHDNKYLKVFGTLLHDPNLWHLNRKSVSMAFLVGLFFMWVPVPFQMWLAAGTAILIRSNLPISVALVWITNPITMPPMFYFAYLLGAWMLHVPPSDFHFAPTLEWLTSGMLVIWKPFLTGCFALGVVSGVIGFVAIRLLWRMHIVHYIKERRKRVLAK